MKVSELIENLRYGLLNDIYPFEENSDYGKDKLLLNWVSRSVRQVSRDIPHLKYQYRFKVVEGIDEYPLPKDFITPHSLTKEDGTSVLINEDSGSESAIFTGRSIVIPFSYSGEMSLEYFRIHPKIVSPDDEILINDAFIDLVETYVAYLAHNRQGNKQSEGSNLFYIRYKSLIDEAISSVMDWAITENERFRRNGWV